jgi:hypothetical protein
VCWAWRLRSEVEVLSWDPDRGNPTSMRQGRGPEFTGRSQCGCLRCGASSRAGLKEVVGVSRSRTRVKRRKASFLTGADSNAVTRGGTLEDRTSVAQWQVEIMARRSKTARLAADEQLRGVRVGVALGGHSAVVRLLNVYEADHGLRGLWLIHCPFHGC